MHFVVTSYLIAIILICFIHVCKRKECKVVKKKHLLVNKTLGRARDPRANGAWLNKLTE